MTIARTILEQLGGGRFVAMTGARAFVSTGKGLRFRLPCRKANVVEITLTPSDEYDMRFWLLRGDNVKEVKRFEGVYFDQLQDLFTEATGLYTHL
jgi:hypothetical protein